MPRIPAPRPQSSNYIMAKQQTYDRPKAELLAPCGNYDCVIAAVNAGADAVYLGGQLFNARAYASNFDNETLEKVCDLCHSFGVKVYVTVNTLYKDEEFSQLIPFIDALYAMGVDGLIMQDLGAIHLVRKNWPDLNVHASTQLTANSLDDVKELEALGIRTAVLSRELNLKEIRSIAEQTEVRIEVFIHGALCVSYSGQCLMSSVLGNRSGNRGKCAQNCRLNYELLSDGKALSKGHLLSTKDICTLELLPELLESGAASLKIEGRMKSPEYVAGVTGIYRKYLDKYYSGEPYSVDPQDIAVLRQLFNRGSFSSGYLKTHSGTVMMCPTHPRAWGVPAGKVLSYDAKKRLAAIRFDKSMVPGDGIEIRTDAEEGIGCYVEQACEARQDLAIRIEGDITKNQEVWQTYDKRLMDRLRPEHESLRRKVPLQASVSLHQGRPAMLTFSANGTKISISGETPAAAENQPLTRETVSEQLSKLGNTIYQMEQIHIEMDEGLFLNRSALNALKNRAAEELTGRVIASAKRQKRAVTPDSFAVIPAGKGKSLSVCVRTTEQFRAALTGQGVANICIEMNEELMADPADLAAAAHESGRSLYVKLPRIWRAYIRENTDKWLEKCKEAGIDGWLISNLGHYHAVKDTGKEIILDFTGNILNSHTIAFWTELGVTAGTVSPEMSRDEINVLADRSQTELLAYGVLPLMVTHQCPIGNYAGGKSDRIYCACRGKTSGYVLRSGKDVFRLETDCRNCICTVTTAEPIDIREDVNRFDVHTVRLNFTDEDGKTAERIIREYGRILSSGRIPASPAPNIYDKSVL